MDFPVPRGPSKKKLVAGELSNLARITPFYHAKWRFDRHFARFVRAISVYYYAVMNTSALATILTSLALMLWSCSTSTGSKAKPDAPTQGAQHSSRQASSPTQHAESDHNDDKAEGSDDYDDHDTSDCIADHNASASSHAKDEEKPHCYE